MRKPLLMLVFLKLTALLLFTAGGTARACEGPADPDEIILSKAKVATDNASLLAYLRNKSGDEADLLRMHALIRQLGSDKPNERKMARQKLIALGFVAVPLLQRATRDNDAQIKREAKECLAEIAKETKWWVPAAVVRLLVRRNPQGTAEKLLRYLPFAPEGDTEEEVWFGLSNLASEGKLSRLVLRNALNDLTPARRALAGCLLGRVGSALDRESVRKLLEDPDLTVRLRAAQGLLAGKDTSGIPDLTGLLDQTNLEIAWQAEELLRWLAGERSPKALVGVGNTDDRKKCKTAWEEFWEGNTDHRDLLNEAQKSRRPFLVLMSGLDDESPGTRRHKAWLCGSDGSVRWKLRNLDPSCRVRFIGQNRAFVVEGMEKLLIKEQTLDGKELWKGQSDSRGGPTLCECLPDGSKIVIAGWSLVLVASDGTVSTHEMRDYARMRAESLGPNGRLVFIDRADVNTILEVSPVSKEVCKTVRVQSKMSNRGHNNCIRALTDGRYLLTLPSEGRVIKLSSEGRQVWEHAKASAILAVPLRGGSFLIAAHEAIPGRLILLNSKGNPYAQVIPRGPGSMTHSMTPCLNLIRIGFEGAASPRDLDSVADLAQGLSSSDLLIRQRSAVKLQRLNLQAAPARQALVRALSDPDEGVRVFAGEALANLRAVPDLVGALKSENTNARATAAYALQVIKPEIEAEANVAAAPLVNALSDKDAYVRYRAALALGRYKTKTNLSLEPLIAALRDREKVPGYGCVSDAVLHAIAQLGPAAKGAIPQILPLMQDSPESETRILAALALGETAPESAEVQNALLSFLKRTNNRREKVAIIRALAHGGSKAKTALPELIRILKSTTSGLDRDLVEERRALITALGEIGRTSEGTVGPLLAIARDSKESIELRIAAVRALARTGPPAKKAVEALKSLDKDTDPNLQDAVSAALEKLRQTP